MNATVKRTEARKEFLCDVFITALEGGIGYWSQASAYHWAKSEKGTRQDLDGFYATIYDTETDRDYNNELRIDIATISSGVHRLASGEVPIRDDIRSTIVQANRANDASDIDAECADCIVQAGIYNEVRYS